MYPILRTVHLDSRSVVGVEAHFPRLDLTSHVRVLVSTQVRGALRLCERGVLGVRGAADYAGERGAHDGPPGHFHRPPPARVRPRPPRQHHRPPLFPRGAHP
eukprot:2817570-Pyramimonas_sp.AAC.1